MYIVTRNTLGNLPAPSTYHRWACDFLELPPIALGAKGLALRAQSSDIPSVENEKTTVEQRGFSVHFSGKDVFSGSFNMTFVNCIDSLTKEAFQDWKEACCNLRDGSSFAPAVYKGILQVADLSYDNSIIKIYTLHGVFPQNIAPADGYGTSVDAQSLNIDFSYDYWD